MTIGRDLPAAGDPTSLWADPGDELLLELARTRPSAPAHSCRVAELVERVATWLGLGGDELATLRLASLLHDIGKIRISAAVLAKPGMLSPDEYRLVQQHAKWGAQLAQDAALSPAVVRLIHDHHDRLDGSGYPSRLGARQLDLQARILAVCDLYDALTSDRPYRAAWAQRDAIAYLQNESALFDRTCAEALRAVVPTRLRAASNTRKRAHVRSSLVMAALVAILLAAAPSAAAPSAASASGSNYVVVGGTPAERSQVRKALAVSRFDWNLVPETVTVTLGRDLVTESTPGQITVATGLVDSGRFSWGFVQHEYAHQVGFFLLNDQTRAMFLSLLGGTTWFPATDKPTPFWQIGAERFASMLSWSYWPSKDNADDTLAAGSRNNAGELTTPARFRALLAGVLDQ